MSEESNAAVVDQVDEESQVTAADAEELAAFEAEINGTPLPKSTKEADADVEDEHTEKADTTPEPPAKTEAPSVSVPGVTQEQLNELFSTVKTVEELKTGIAKLRDDAFGRLGGLERTMKERVDSGFDWELTREDFKDIEEAVPFLADPLNKVLNNLAKKAKVKIPAPQTINVDEIRSTLKAEVQAELNESRAQMFKEMQSELLTERFPTWQQDVAKPEFGTWLEAENVKQPGLKQMFLSSIRANEIGGVLKNYHEHVKAQAQPPAPKLKPKPSAGSRTQRLAEALPPRGTSSATPPSKGPLSEEEAFEEAASRK